MLPEISLSILDIAQNSITAGADRIDLNVEIDHKAQTLLFEIRDNGCGMSEEQVLACQDPFYTSRTTRSVGLGVPFLKQSAECTGGTFRIESAVGMGTSMTALYRTDSIDCMPLGDLADTYHNLIVYNEPIHFVCRYAADGNELVLDTDEFHEILGDISFQEAEISAYIDSFLRENMQEIDDKAKTEEEHEIP